jgi:hypothetical protein
MAAGTWKMVNNAKQYFGTATMPFPGTYRMALFTSASNLKTLASAKPLILLGSVTSQVTSGYNYCSSGKTIPNEAWAVGANASTMHFDFTATGVKWSANGGTIAAIKYAAIFLSAAAAGGCYLLAYVTLTTATGGLSLADTNTLTIKPSATGIFTLGGM